MAATLPGLGSLDRAVLEALVRSTHDELLRAEMLLARMKRSKRTPGAVWTSVHVI